MEDYITGFGIIALIYINYNNTQLYFDKKHYQSNGR